MNRVPIIISQSERYLQLAVPSKSKPGTYRTVEYKPNGDKDCSCPGVHWFKVKGQDLYKLCRHQKMTTIPPTHEYGIPRQMLNHAKRLIKNKKAALYAAWGNVQCQYYQYYKDDETHCMKCPLYPEVCNIHKIMYGRGPQARLPLIWRLQTACYNNKRREAQRIINQIINYIKKEMKT
jgi:hypothetical protein